MECSKCSALLLIENSLSKLTAQLEELMRITLQNSFGSNENVFLDAQALMVLPDHLRKTALFVRLNGRVRAEDVAAYTKRARAVESGYLNVLVNMKCLGRERRGHHVYFFLLTSKGVQ
jgi:hypothetical protein